MPSYGTLYGANMKKFLSLISFVFLAMGCAEKKPTVDNNCKYVYERNPVEEAKPLDQRTPDHIVMFFSATHSTSGKVFNPGPVHNFAIFAKIRGDKTLENVTISWFPQSMQLTRNVSEQGVNLDLAKTIEWAKVNNCRLERVGPYYIHEDLYNKAKKQVERLALNAVQYKENDSGLRPDSATNSVHAISDILCNGDKFDVYLVNTGKGRDANLILKTYFDTEGYLDGKYRNDKDLLKEFDLQHIKKID